MESGLDWLKFSPLTPIVEVRGMTHDHYYSLIFEYAFPSLELLRK